jgi:putative tryptophan/tyrosine transport system substrate-binding protein
MRRREFMALAAALAACPRFADAEQRAMPKIGFLATATIAEIFTAHLKTALRDAGYMEGKTLQLEMRTPARPVELAQAAAELVKARVDVIVSAFTVPTQAAKQATSSVPIVFLGAGDPVGTGLVASLNRPGGNVTGIGDSSAEANAKALEILCEVLPAARRVAVLTDPADPYTKTFIEHLQQFGKRRSVDVHAVPVRSHDMLEAVIEGLNRPKPDAAIIQGSFPRRAAELLLKHGIPSGATPPTFAEAGSMVCYAIDNPDTCRKAADYIQRILKGASPADLPVQVPKRNVIINVKTARTLGITVPRSVLLRAERIIE